MPGDNGRRFISFARWLRLKIYRSLGRVKMNHCQHGEPLLAGISLPWKAKSDLQEGPGDPGGLGWTPWQGSVRGVTGWIEDTTPW